MSTSQSFIAAGNLFTEFETYLLTYCSNRDFDFTLKLNAPNLMMIKLISEDISIKLQLYVVCLTEQNISDTLDLGVPTSARTKSCHILLLEFDSDCLTQKIYKIIGHSGLPENNLVVVSLWTMSNLLRCTQTN